MNFIKDYISGLPKAELHLHIEGSFEPDLMFKIAKRNKIKLKYKTVEEIKAAYDFDNLQEFLDLYYIGTNVLITKQDFYDLTWDYLEKAHEEGILHTEIFFDPQAHTSRGVSFQNVVEGIHDAMHDAEEEFGISSFLIMSFLRHLSEEDAFKTLEEAMPHLDKIMGIGLDSTELGNPPRKFENVFAKAKSLGLKLMAHAGEEGPSEYISDSIEFLKIDRIDHGNRCIDDDDLIHEICDKNIPLTICPLSNLKLKVVRKMEDHPLKTMLLKGLKVTINSDDPAYFGGYVNDNYLAVYDALDMDRRDLFILAKNSIKASFASEQRKKFMLDKLNEYENKFPKEWR